MGPSNLVIFSVMNLAHEQDNDPQGWPFYYMPKFIYAMKRLTKMVMRLEREWGRV